MTSTSAAPGVGGTSSVLLIWSLLIIVIGVALFIYSLVVTRRSRRRRRRRRPGTAVATMSGHGPRPLPPPPASRPFGMNANLPSTLPSGPTAGGQPVARHFGGPNARALPSGPSAGPGRYPGPPPAALPAGPSAGSYGAPQALPAGPVVGSGYGGSGYGYRGPAPYPQPPGPAPTPPSFEDPGYAPVPQYGYAGPAHPGAVSGVPAIAATPHDSGTTYGTPATSSYGTPEPHSAAPAQREDPSRRGRRKVDECAQLRAECEQLREIAAAAQASATQAALDAEAAHADFLSAQRAADETRRAYEIISREAAEVAAEVAALDRSAAPVSEAAREKLQAETSHAAFAAYRRGDISSEQLREVFKRAEGWTPEHDRLSRRANELRVEETEAIRHRDAAQQAAEDAGERARAAAITARGLDDQARTAALDARGRCAAADACEQRRR